MGNKSVLAKCILIPLAAGVLSAFFSGGGMQAFAMLNKPAWAPPAWVFPVVWTVLYVMMGIASYLICTAVAPQREVVKALAIYGLQLAVNFLWSIFFFGFGWLLFSFIWIILLWVLVLLTALHFYKISVPAAWLLVPYLVWVAIAGCLCFQIWLLN